MSGEVDVRPMREQDVPAATAVGHEALREAGTRYGWESSPLAEDDRPRAEARQAHLLRTDPEGCFVADRDGEVVGVALSMVRGPLWFLSLLGVAPGLQGQGVGGRLLDAALRSSEGVPIGFFEASSDPKALRRYSRSGFALVPGYDAKGVVDRTRLPAVPAVREGDWARDGERLDDLVAQLRGAPYGPDLEPLSGQGARVLVTEAGPGRHGIAVVAGSRLRVLAATDPREAQALLWAALAGTGEEPVEVEPLTAGQQWAIEVVLEARLSLSPGASLCTRGPIGPLSPYLPSGAYG